MPLTAEQKRAHRAEQAAVRAEEDAARGIKRRSRGSAPVGKTWDGTQRMKARSVRASRTQAARRQREHAAFMGGAGPLDRRPGDAEVPGCQPSPIERALAAMVMRQSKYATHTARQRLGQNSCGASDQMGAMGAVP